MNHEQLRERLSDLRDGELSGDEASELAAHLEACAECRRDLELYGRAAALFRPAPLPTRQETEFFVRAVRSRLEEPAVPAFLSGLLSSPRWAVPAFAFAVAAAVLAVVPSSTQKTYDPADALLISQDGGQAYSWLSGSADASTAALLPMEER